MKEMDELLQGFPAIIELPVVWGEMDALRHVNNAAYFRYIESGRMDYFARVGVDELLRERGIGPILHSTACRFRIPLTYPDTVSVGTRISQINEDRFTMETRIVSHRHRRVAADAHSVIVTLDYAQQKKVPIPDDLRRRIAALEASPT